MAGQQTAANAVNCFTCQVREKTEWCVLDDDELTLIDSSKISKIYSPGEVIFREGDNCRGVFCVESGLVGVRKTDADGNSILLYLATPGDTLGYQSLLTGDEFSASAEALENSVVCLVDKSAVRTMLEQNPALGLRFLQRASRDLGAAEEKILQNATLSVRARFAHLLAVLIDRYGGDNGDGEMLLELPLSRHDMASMIGTTPESMSRTIRKLEDDGVAMFSGRTVTIPELDVLIQEFEPDTFV